MVRVADWPVVQNVPGAMGWTTDHAPEAHCWKELPAIQLNWPSGVQGPVRAPAEGVVLVELEAAAGALVAEGADEATGGDATMEKVVGNAEAMAEARPAASVDGAEAGVATDEAVRVETVAEDAGVPPAGEGAADDEPLTMASALQAQVGEKNGLEPAYWTYWPGFGNINTELSSSGVEQWPQALATNMGGKSARLESGTASMVSRLLAAAVTVTGAQFMYISRLPTLLNQVQARVYFPGLIPSGIENWNLVAPSPLGSSGRLPAASTGHPPRIE